MADSNRFTALIAGAMRDKPKFQQWVYELTQPLEIARQRLAALQDDFDIDRAVGVQLDAIGVRVGMSRRMDDALTGIYFAFDGLVSEGFDRGTWRQIYGSGNANYVLDDDAYRVVLKAKVLANQWNGSREGAQQMIEKICSYFSLPSGSITLTETDGDLMTVTVAMDRTEVPPVVWAVFYQGKIIIAPAGVTENIVDLSQG